MAQKSARIVKDEEIRGGEPHIEGRRITVRHVRALVEGAGLSAQEVAERHGLGVADVYRALTYYYDHPEEMAELEAREHEREHRAREDSAKTLAELAESENGE